MIEAETQIESKDQHLRKASENANANNANANAGGRDLEEESLIKTVTVIVKDLEPTMMILTGDAQDREAEVAVAVEIGTEIEGLKEEMIDVMTDEMTGETMEETDGVKTETDHVTTRKHGW
jgi:hypothetical protein